VILRTKLQPSSRGRYAEIPVGSSFRIVTVAIFIDDLLFGVFLFLSRGKIQISSNYFYRDKVDYKIAFQCLGDGAEDWQRRFLPAVFQPPDM